MTTNKDKTMLSYNLKNASKFYFSNYCFGHIYYGS